MGRMLFIVVLGFITTASYIFLGINQSNMRSNEIVSNRVRTIECKLNSKEIANDLISSYLSTGVVDTVGSYFSNHNRQAAGRIRLLGQTGNTDSLLITGVDSTYGYSAKAATDVILVGTRTLNNGSGDSPFKKMAEELYYEDPNRYEKYFDKIPKQEKQKWNALSLVCSNLAARFGNMTGHSQGTNFVTMRNNALSNPSLDFEEEFYDWVVNVMHKSNLEGFMDEDLARFIMPWEVLDSLGTVGIVDIYTITAHDFNGGGSWHDFVRNLEVKNSRLTERDGFKGSGHQGEILTPAVADSIAKSYWWPQYHNSSNNNNQNGRAIDKMVWKERVASTDPNL